MEIIARTYIRSMCVAVVLIFIVLLSSCQPKSSNQFSDLKEWDLLIISDSSNWGVGQYYAQLIEEDMHVPVNLHDRWIGGLPMGRILRAL